MLLFDNLFNQAKQIARKPKYVTKIHIFFEGAVSEQEVVAMIKKEFNKDENILSFIEISANKPTNSIAKINRIIKQGWYTNTEQKRTTIAKDETILLLYDVDVFYGNHGPAKKEALKKRLGIIKSLIANDSITFIWIASFPCFEYGLSLGLTSSLDKNKVLGTIDEIQIKAFLSHIAGKKFKKYDKSYKKIFYDTKIFKVDILRRNALADRQNKNLPLTHTDFANMIKEDKLLSNLKNDCPFSYLDYLFITIENKIKEVIENSDK